MAQFDERKHLRGGDPANSGRFSAHRHTPPEVTPFVALNGLRAAPAEHVEFADLSSRHTEFLSASSTERVLIRYQARLTSLAFNDAALEGNTFTLPEVEAVRTGTVPQGRTEDEINQILALTESSEYLIKIVHGHEFRLDAETSDQLHARIAQFEVIDAGKRRGTGIVSHDDGVSVNVQGQQFTGYQSRELPHVATVFGARISEMKHPVSRALNYAAAASYAQFYHDANKRTARYLMNGELLAHGFDAIEVPVADEREYHNAAGEMFRSGRLRPYVDYLLHLGQLQARANR